MNIKKSYLAKNIYDNCEHCKTKYLKESYNQQWCKECVPDTKARSIMQRYDISHLEYLDMLNIYSSCPICLRELVNPAIDHDHKTGKIRGLICHHCNTALYVIEDKAKLQRAMEYLGVKL